MKKNKRLAKYIAKKVLKPPEAERMIRAAGWREDPNDSGSTSHRQYIRKPGEGKITIPFHSDEINEYTTRDIKKQAGLI